MTKILVSDPIADKGIAILVRRKAGLLRTYLDRSSRSKSPTPPFKLHLK